jgi:flagellar biosynthesis/type III secretory pathway protein FliH
MEGLSEGASDGTSEGAREGTSDGLSDGMSDGASDGMSEGISDGTSDGMFDGISEGRSDGMSEGRSDGISEGMSDGISDRRTIVLLASRASGCIETADSAFFRSLFFTIATGTEMVRTVATTATAPMMRVFAESTILLTTSS